MKAFRLLVIICPLEFCNQNFTPQNLSNKFYKTLKSRFCNGRKSCIGSEKAIILVDVGSVVYVAGHSIVKLNWVNYYLVLINKWLLRK